MHNVSSHPSLQCLVLPSISGRFRYLLRPQLLTRLNPHETSHRATFSLQLGLYGVEGWSYEPR